MIREVGQQLVTLTRKRLEQRPPVAEPVRRTLENVEELGQRLNQAKLTRDDALKDLAKVTEQIRQQSSELSKNPALRRMSQAARTPGGRNPSSPSPLQKQMDALQKQLGEKAVSPETAESLKNDLEKLKDAAKGLADNAAGNSDAAKKQLSTMTSDLARKAEAL